MTKCAKCGAKLEGRILRNEYRDTLTNFINDDELTKVANQFVMCECGRKITITPEMKSVGFIRDEI